MLTNFKPIDRVSSKASAHQATEANAVHRQLASKANQSGDIIAITSGQAKEELSLLVGSAMPKLIRMESELRAAIDMAASGAAEDISRAAEMYSQWTAALAGLYYGGLMD